MTGSWTDVFFVAAVFDKFSKDLRFLGLSLWIVHIYLYIFVTFIMKFWLK